jgi:hypothetical protein
MGSGGRRQADNAGGWERGEVGGDGVIAEDKFGGDVSQRGEHECAF